MPRTGPTRLQVADLLLRCPRTQLLHGKPPSPLAPRPGGEPASSPPRWEAAPAHPAVRKSGAGAPQPIRPLPWQGSAQSRGFPARRGARVTARRQGRDRSAQIPAQPQPFPLRIPALTWALADAAQPAPGPQAPSPPSHREDQDPRGLRAWLRQERRRLLPPAPSWSRVLSSLHGCPSPTRPRHASAPSQGCHSEVTSCGKGG